MTRVAFGLLISLSGLVPGAALVAQADAGRPPGPGLTDRPADRADVASIDAIVHAFYDVVSGPAGEARDWARDSTLYLRGTEFTVLGRGEGERVAIDRVDHAEYARRSAPFFEDGFFESEIHRVTHRFGPLAQVFSTYEWRRTPDGTVGGRGINSLQLTWDGRRWWIAAAAWVDEDEAHPIPPEYLPPGGGSGPGRPGLSPGTAAASEP